MIGYRFTSAIWFGLGLLAFAGCAPQSQMAASKSSDSAIAPGMARVWFFRQAGDPLQGNVYGADPTIYANGAPVAQITQRTAFYHDFPPGKYRFTVQPYGTPTREHDTVQLVPGAQAYLQVQWEQNWEANRTGGGSSFTVLSSSPEVAQQYLPTLNNLGQR
jgi:hypothetical protein